MNAMLEPRIVAASTHARDLSVHGAPKAPARITASSHGCFISNLDAYELRMDSGLVATRVRSHRDTAPQQRRFLRSETGLSPGTIRWAHPSSRVLAKRGEAPSRGSTAATPKSCSARSLLDSLMPKPANEHLLDERSGSLRRLTSR